MGVEEIGKLIRSERKAQGLTQGELAMTAHTASRFISAKGSVRYFNIK